MKTNIVGNWKGTLTTSTNHQSLYEVNFTTGNIGRQEWVIRGQHTNQGETQQIYGSFGKENHFTFVDNETLCRCMIDIATGCIKGDMISNGIVCYFD